MSKAIKIVRITTVPLSLQKLIAGQMGFMASRGFEVIMVSSDFEDKHTLEDKERAKFIPIHMTRKISPIQDLAALYRLFTLLKSLKPAIVHTHTPKAGLIGMLASKLAGVPIRLHTVAGLPLMEAKGLKRLILEQVEKLTYACATKVYPNSTNLKEFIISSNFTRLNKVRVIGNGSSNGIDTGFFKRTPEIEALAQSLCVKWKLTNDNFIYVLVGRLVKDKGVEELVSAFDTLSKAHPAIRLILVGPEEAELDPLSPNCLEIIKSNQAIISVGYQDDVKPYLALSNVLTFPSYREGFPNVPMQAGCFDLPSIVTNINGCNEIIVEGENGLIIPVKNVNALKDAMEKIYIDKELYGNMVKKARRLIVDRYEQQAVWDLILHEYKGHLKNKGFVQDNI